MSRLCELTGVGPQFGNNVSHSKRRTRRKFLPNIQSLCFISDTTKQNYRFKVVPSALKAVEKNGGIDNFLLNSSNNDNLSKKAIELKNLLKKIFKNNEAKKVV
jgi:large subunit ribosomal protein L28